MRIETLLEFIDLSIDCNFSACANRLSMSQSALSSHIIGLEKEVGYELVKRGIARSLTPEGKTFLEYAHKMVALYDESKIKCKQIHDMKKKTMKVNVGFGRYNLADQYLQIVSTFIANNPDAAISVIKSDEGSSVSSLSQKAVDIDALVSMEDPAPKLARMGLACVPLACEEAGVWVPLSSPLGNKKRISPEDLEGYAIPFIQHMHGNNWKDAIRDFSESKGIELLLQYNKAESLEELALDIKENEILIHPISFLESARALHLRKDRVIKRFEDPIWFTMYICYRRDDGNPTVANLISWAKENSTCE